VFKSVLIPFPILLQNLIVFLQQQQSLSMANLKTQKQFFFNPNFSSGGRLEIGLGWSVWSKMQKNCHRTTVQSLSCCLNNLNRKAFSPSIPLHLFKKIVQLKAIKDFFT
jgi:hypothetical protein